MFTERVCLTGLPRHGWRAGHQKVTVLVLARVGLQELQLGRIHVHPDARSLFGKGRVGGMGE